MRLAGSGIAAVSPSLILTEMHRTGTAQFVQGGISRLRQWLVEIGLAGD
ncbi:hypothetical protein [Kitasatospora sp. NPDC059571]